MTSDPRPYPISVVIPTRNSMDKLPRHLDHHAPLFARCAEIIHCDSQSKDDTKSYMATKLVHACLHQFDHPPGLYQSWNYAIQQCTQPFIYISTVGDQIELAGLQHLLEIALKTEADLVISPPRFIKESGEPERQLRWPIHHVIDQYRITKPKIIPNAILWAEAVWHAPDGITGSAASCLFRASFLKPRPFPLSYHGAGDSAWAIQHIPEGSGAVTPEPVATFLLHVKSYESNEAINLKIGGLFKELIKEEIVRLRQNPPPLFSQDILRRTRRLMTCNRLTAEYYQDLISIRKKLCGLWFLSQNAWKIRSLHHHFRSKTSILRKELQEMLAKNLKESEQPFP